MEMMSLPWWVWILFYIMVLVMLWIDLKSFGKKGPSGPVWTVSGW